MFSRLRSDIQCILERDPAARSVWEVITCYPGLHAIWWHRPHARRSLRCGTQQKKPAPSLLAFFIAFL